MLGRNIKEPKRSEDDDTSGKFMGLEDSLTLLSKNVARSLNKPPDFNVIKHKDPAYSFSRRERYPKEKKEDKETLRLKDLYYEHQQLLKSIDNQINYDRNKVF